MDASLIQTILTTIGAMTVAFGATYLILSLINPTVSVKLDGPSQKDTKRAIGLAKANLVALTEVHNRAFSNPPPTTKQDVVLECVVQQAALGKLAIFQIVIQAELKDGQITGTVVKDWMHVRTADKHLRILTVS